MGFCRTFIHKKLMIFYVRKLSYYNFDSFYNQDDLDFVYCITRDFEKLDAIVGNYIQNEIDDVYLFNCANELRDTIMYELTNYSSFKDIKITS